MFPVFGRNELLGIDRDAVVLSEVVLVPGVDHFMVYTAIVPPGCFLAGKPPP
jgi:hypothetical protein